MQTLDVCEEKWRADLAGVDELLMAIPNCRIEGHDAVGGLSGRGKCHLNVTKAGVNRRFELIVDAWQLRMKQL